MYINFKEQAIIVVKVHHHQGLNGFHYVDEGNQSMDIGGEVAVKWFAVEKGSEEKV